MLLLPLVILASTLYQLALLYTFNVSCGTLLAHGRGSLNCELERFLSKEPVEAGPVTLAERDCAYAYYDSRLTVSLTVSLGYFQGSIPIDNHYASLGPAISIAEEGAGRRFED